MKAMMGSMKLVQSGVAFLGGIAVSSLAWAQQPGPSYGPYMWHGSWYGWFFGPLMMILFLVVAVAAVVLLVRWLGAPRHEPPGHTYSPPTKAPLDILKERFARGEIDKDEFEERRKILER
jgi:putative membrane protein